MPLYHIGKTHQPVRPSFAHLDEKGIVSRAKPDAAKVNQWFDDAFRKFTEDPYVQLDRSSPADVANFRVLTKNEDGTLQMSKLQGITNMENLDMDAKRMLYQASRAGHLFYYDPSIGEKSGLRQIYTKDVIENGKTEQELCTTEDVMEFPEVPKPKAPAPWKYIAAIFSKQYRQEIREYNQKASAHAEVNSFVKTINTQAEQERNEIKSPMRRETMLENKRQRIEAYEKGKKVGLESDVLKSPAEFVKEIKALAAMTPGDILYDEFLSKDNRSIGDFCRAGVKILMRNFATMMMQTSAGKTDAELMTIFEAGQMEYRQMERDIKAYVPAALDLKAVEQIANNPMSAFNRQMAAQTCMEPIQKGGLFAFYEYRNAMSGRLPQEHTKQMQNNEVQKQQDAHALDPMARK